MSADKKQLLRDVRLVRAHIRYASAFVGWSVPDDFRAREREALKAMSRIAAAIRALKGTR